MMQNSEARALLLHSEFRGKHREHQNESARVAVSHYFDDEAAATRGLAEDPKKHCRQHR